MKDNGEKWHLLVTSKKNRKATIEEGVIENSQEEKYLVINFDTTLSFESNISCLCNKASQNLQTVARITNHMDLKKRRLGRKHLLRHSLITVFLSGCFQPGLLTIE